MHGVDTDVVEAHAVLAFHRAETKHFLVSIARLFELFDKIKSKDAEELILFDLYRGKGIDPGQKSMAIRVRYRSPERTLTDEEVNKAHGKLVEMLCKELNAKIR
jgi:phenylalanyl-tRNA synthetase beta chain